MLRDFNLSNLLERLEVCSVTLESIYGLKWKVRVFDKLNSLTMNNLLPEIIGIKFHSPRRGERYIQSDLQIYWATGDCNMGPRLILCCKKKGVEKELEEEIDKTVRRVLKKYNLSPGDA